MFTVKDANAPTGGRAAAQEETIADPIPAAPVPHTGDRGILRDAAGRGVSDDAGAATQQRLQIEVAIDEHALAALSAAFAARDHYGYRDLHERGGFFLVAAGTRAKILLPPKRSDDGLAGWRVRVLDGEHEGRAGWVCVVDFERTDPDADPFPPGTTLEA